MGILPRKGDNIIEQLNCGNMVVARSKNEFLYIVDINDKFHLFYHTPGAASGGKKQFEKNEKHIAVIRNIANLSDSLFEVAFDIDSDLYGVMASAEEAILTAFPGDNRDADEDIEFVIRDRKNSSNQEDN